MLLVMKQHFQPFKANAVNGRFLAHHHVCLFTDMSVIDQYFINQSTELANNMTYMREASPVSARLLSISKHVLSAPLIYSQCGAQHR